MLRPKDCLQKLKSSDYISKNIDFLKPIYAELYKGIGKNIDFDDSFINHVDKLKSYLKSAYKLKKENSLKSNDDIITLGDLLNKKVDLFKIANSLNSILDELIQKRSNKNGLELFLWLILGVSSLEEISGLRNNNDLLVERLVSSEILTTIINTDYIFFEIIISDLMCPLELKAPNRRKGSFDKLVLSEIRKRLNLGDSFSTSSDNWIIDERKVKQIKNLTLLENLKYPDFICKINNVGFIGAHKEQNSAGGAQDNQIIDAQRILGYSENPHKEELKSILKTKEIKAVIIYDTFNKELRTGRHWDSLYELIEKSQNKYLVNSIIFIELLKSC